VLTSLVTHGIPIDLIAGTSGGALYGSLLACGLSVDAVQARVIHNTRKNLRDRSDYTIPRTGLIRGNAIERMVHESTGGARFEDLHIPLYAVAADLATGEEVVVERGPVSHGVRASISVPGLFEPFTVDGRVLVDGGVVNPLPVSVCRARGADFVIAVSVPAPGKLNRGTGPLRYNIVSVVMRSYYFAGDVIANASVADADVLIAPSVEHFGWRDYQSSPAIIAAGREAGDAAIDEIRARLPVRTAGVSNEDVSREGRGDELMTFINQSHTSSACSETSES
jgi:NTE family protein